MRELSGMRRAIALVCFALSAVGTLPAIGAAAPGPTAKPQPPRPAANTLTFANQSPMTLPNLPSAPASGATTISFVLPVPAQEKLAAQLELWCNTNRPFATATLWMPTVATTYTLKNVTIAKCDEKTKGSSGGVAFTLNFSSLDAQK